MISDNGTPHLFAVKFVAWNDQWEAVIEWIRDELTLDQAAKEAAKYIKAKCTPWTFEGFGLPSSVWGPIVAVSVEIERMETVHGKGDHDGNA